ncbi:DNA-binding transcriptional LysR family regulator [Crossiella equi]|uniref:DNA-binding transcriptional LysR family regulator n=1 Tax=Crossiella equi TaxID=130796 RepID=A0ABS5A669_9PSEU|nr:LysR family substrate-binding domain-containing protein [Crossiella equi]MBP2472099.1 DNA-binding transcriptional LysR family regulator [Crossiella equi]
MALSRVAARSAGRAANGETGRLRVGFIGYAPLLRVLGRFQPAYPDVRLGLHEMSSVRAAAALVAGDVDVAVTRGGPRGAGAEELTSVPVGRDRLVAVVSDRHPYAGQRTVDVAQLRAATLVLAGPEEEPATVSLVHRLLGERNAPQGGTVEARDVHTIIGLAASGLGVGLGPECMRVDRRADVRFLPVTPRTELPPLVMSHRTGDPSPVLAAFLAVAREELTPAARPGSA